MKNKARLISAILAFSLILASVFAIGAFASDGEAPLEAEFTNAPNGANAIASMTFDDGIYDTAVLLNTLFKEYGLKGSLMIEGKDVADSNGNINSTAAATWNTLLADGYLVPESHSMNHLNLGNDKPDDSLSIEEKRKEIGGSYDVLKQAFPNYDILSFAIPNSNYDTTELGLVNEKFYVARTGNCVLYHSSYNGKMQSLNPTFDNKAGSWMNTYMVRMQSNNSTYGVTNSPENLVKYLDQCVNDGGWFISLTHAVGPTGEMTEEQMRVVLEAMQEYVEDGKLWVTSMSEATKYTRERQNSEITLNYADGVYTVEVDMADTTEDNLPLPADIFNMPLTVKLSVPTHWTQATYTANGKTETVRAYGSAAGKYVYVNVVPNSDPVVVSDATPDEDKHVAGSYTQPANTWKPDEGSDVTFAVWDSEDDFLAGAEPTAENIYTTNELNETNVGLPRGDNSVKSNYVHLFADCTTATAGQLFVGLNQSLVINLGGYTLDCPKGILLGDASGSRTQAKLTIKNGSFTHTGGNVQCRGESELRYDNVEYTVGGACMNYDDVARLVEFKDSKLIVSGAAYFTAGTRSGWTTCQYNFINTDVITSESNPYLFRIHLSNSSTSPCTIRFDKDSSIIRNSDNPLVVFNKGFNKDADVPIETKVAHYLIFEEGCEISESIAPVWGKGYTYLVQHYNQSTGFYGPNNTAKTEDSEYRVSFDGGFSDGTMFVKVVKPGTNEMIKWQGNFIDDGVVVLDKRVSSAWDPDTDTSDVDYTGITYGLWASEADFLAGDPPAKWSTATTFNNTDLGIDTNGANIADTPVVGYMRFYADLTSAYEDASVSAKKLQIITPASREFVMDLNGFTYNDAVGIRPGGSSGTHPNAYFTMKNGVFQRKGGQMQIRQDVKVTFEKVLIVNNVSNFFYGCAPDLLKFKDSTFFNLTGYGLHMGTPYTNKGYAVSEIIFENTDIIYFTAPVNALFQFNDSAYGDGIYDVIFDQNSSINVDFTDFTLVQLSETYQYPQDVVHSNIKINVIMEDGFTVPKGAKPTFNCTYIAVDKAASKTASDAATENAGKDTTSTVLLAGVILDSSTAADSKFSWLIYAPADHTNGKYDYYTIADKTGHYNSTDMFVANLATFYQYVEFDASGNILNTWPLGSALGTDAAGAFKNTNGSTIKFFHDTEVKNPSTYQANNITFDLNGCTLTKTGGSAFQLGYSMSGQWKERVVKFINTNPNKRGVLDFDNMGSAIQNRPGSIIVFENIDIWCKTSLFTEYGAKSISFTNVNFYTNSASVVIAGGFDVNMVGQYCADGSVREFVFDNCTFDKVNPISWSHNNVVDNVKVTFKGGTTFANNGYAPIRISGDGVDNLEVIIEEGVKIPYLTTTLVAQSGAACATVKGDKITSFVKDGDYYVTAGKPAGMQGSDLQANLTLYTDFQLNFFANPDIITGITLNGENLEATEFEGDDKYTIKNITPNVAADAMEIFVYVKDGETEYILPLTYSILKYSEQIMKTDDAEAKSLVSAAMEYVKAAYVYTGKAAPEFTGVEITAAENNESAVTSLTSAINGVQLNLDSGFKLRFNIKEGYNGTLIIDGATYNVSDGKIGELSYVEVNLRAYQLVNPVTVSDGNTTATYGIANYAKSSVVTADANLKALADALYTYAVYANEYKNNNN